MDRERPVGTFDPRLINQEVADLADMVYRRRHNPAIWTHRVRTQIEAQDLVDRTLNEIMKEQGVEDVNAQVMEELKKRIYGLLTHD